VRRWWRTASVALVRQVLRQLATSESGADPRRAVASGLIPQRAHGHAAATVSIHTTRSLVERIVETALRAQVMSGLMADACFAPVDASGLAVGLPEGVMGNSEVGHLTIGAGQAQYQDLVRINLALKDGTFNKQEHLVVRGPPPRMCVRSLAPYTASGRAVAPDPIGIYPPLCAACTR
jgi:hypothetical protein